MKKITLFSILVIGLGMNSLTHAWKIVNATPGEIEINRFRLIAGEVKTGKEIGFEDFPKSIEVIGLSNPIKDMRIKIKTNNKFGFYVIYLDNPVYISIDEANKNGISFSSTKIDLPIIKPGTGKLKSKYIKSTGSSLI